MEDTIPITRLAVELTALTGKPCPKTYRNLWLSALSGHFPAHQQGSRWYVARDDLTKIAKSLGMMAETPRRQRKGATAQHAA